MAEELPEEIRFQGEIYLTSDPKKPAEEEVVVNLFIEGEIDGESLQEPAYTCLFDCKPDFYGHGQASEAQMVDLAFQRFVIERDFVNIQQEGARGVLELYADEKSHGLAGQELTYRFRRVVLTDEEAKAPLRLGAPNRFLRFRLTADREGLPV